MQRAPDKVQASSEGRRGDAQDFGGGVGLAQGFVKVLLRDGAALDGGDLESITTSV